MATSSIRNLTSAQAYAIRAEELLALVKGLEEEVIDSLIDSHEADWGHVGDVGRALELVRELHTQLNWHEA